MIETYKNNPMEILELINTNINMKISSDEFNCRLDIAQQRTTKLLRRKCEFKNMKNTKENVIYVTNGEKFLQLEPQKEKKERMEDK